MATAPGGSGAGSLAHAPGFQPIVSTRFECPPSAVGSTESASVRSGRRPCPESPSGHSGSDPSAKVAGGRPASSVSSQLRPWPQVVRTLVGWPPSVTREAVATHQVAVAAVRGHPARFCGHPPGHPVWPAWRAGLELPLTTSVLRQHPGGTGAETTGGSQRAAALRQGVNVVSTVSDGRVRVGLPLRARRELRAEFGACRSMARWSASRRMRLWAKSGASGFVHAVPGSGPHVGGVCPPRTEHPGWHCLRGLSSVYRLGTGMARRAKRWVEDPRRPRSA